jgi:hypothetical protein
VAAGSGPRRPGNAPSAFVNGLNDVDRYQRRSARGRAKSGIDLTGVGDLAAVGGPSALVKGRNDIDQTV